MNEWNFILWLFSTYVIMLEKDITVWITGLEFNELISEVLPVTLAL